ncbi:hypothetical protein Q1695_015570 [Nippostrongylus brasiliensis]|nr:hypothetical protein Q1695_015570 [Nippostrongylus brasiliensis]
MVEQLTCLSEQGFGNLNQTLRRSIRRGQDAHVLGGLNSALCQCAADGKQYILHGGDNVVYIAGGFCGTKCSTP